MRALLLWAFFLDEKLFGQGIGATKKEAAQQAAHLALEKIAPQLVEEM